MRFVTRVRQWLPVLSLLCLLGATYWLNQQAQPDPTLPDGNTRHDPDSIVENFSALKLNKQGMPYFIMSAAKMLHYPDDDSTTLETPSMTLLAEDSPSLLATATTGSISRKGDEMFLQKNVEVLLEAENQHDQLKMQTEYLHIIPDQDLVSSNRAVTLTDPHTTVKALGMEMNNKTRQIKLLSQVKGKYVLPNKQTFTE